MYLRSREPGKGDRRFEQKEEKSKEEKAKEEAERMQKSEKKEFYTTDMSLLNQPEDFHISDYYITNKVIAGNRYYVDEIMCCGDRA